MKFKSSIKGLKDQIKSLDWLHKTQSGFSTACPSHGPFTESTLYIECEYMKLFFIAATQFTFDIRVLNGFI